MSWKEQVGALCFLSVAALGARAQWSDGFESYADGSPVEGQGGWQGWDGNNGFFSVVTSNQAGEGNQSLVVVAGADTVQPFSGYDSGKWELGCKVYLPRAFRGKTYFLLLNTYQDGGPYEFAVQLVFNGDSGMLECPCGSFTQTTVPLVLSAWTELRFVIDLDHDLVDVSYGATLLASYPWSSGTYGVSNFSQLSIAAFDLYPNVGSTPHVTEVYFDAFELVPFGGEVGTTYCYGDGSATTCPCFNFGGTGEGCANSTGAGAALVGLGSLSFGADDLACRVTGLIPNQPVLLFAALNAVAGGNGVVFGDGLRCAGGNVRRLGVRIPGPTGQADWGPGLNAAGGWTVGDTRRFQAWYRNPSGSPCGNGFNLSNGLEIVFEP